MFAASRPRLPAATGTVAAIAFTLLATAAIERGFGRPPICACGRVALWHGALDSGNSQHLLDWYSLSHLIHGLLLYALAAALLPRAPVRWRLAAAVLVEAGWEVLENSPIVVDRYRTATIALGYTGDAIVNSLADIGCMAAGFAIAARLRPRRSLALGVVLELAALAAVRDNLTLNVLMLVHPVPAIRAWQAG